MLYATIRQRQVYVKKPVRVVRNGVNVDTLVLDMDDEWSAMTSIICVFTTLYLDAESAPQTINKEILVKFGEPVLVPWENLTETGRMSLSLTGYVGSEQIMRTAKADTYWEIVQEGVNKGEPPLDPTPSLLDQILAAVNDANLAAELARQTANDLQAAADRGDFDGKPGTPGQPGKNGSDAKQITQIDTSIDDQNRFRMSVAFTDGGGVSAPALSLPATVKASETPVEITDEVTMLTYFYDRRKSPNRRYQYEIEQDKGQNLVAALGGYPDGVDASHKYFIYIDLPYSEAGGFTIIATLQGRGSDVLRQRMFWGTLNANWRHTAWLDMTTQGGVDQAYVDDQDASVLEAAKAYTDALKIPYKLVVVASANPLSPDTYIADHKASEIRNADISGNMVELRYTAPDGSERLYRYEDFKAGQAVFRRIYPDTATGGIWTRANIKVNEDYTIEIDYATGKAVNPKGLTFTGAVSATYDGSEAVSVHIPTGGGGTGEDGGYYTPTVTQPDPNTMRVGYTASSGIMPPVAPVDVALTPGKDGKPGDAGQPGFSPVVEVSAISGGHRVTITDKDGPQSFNVENGKDGNPGAPGTPGTPGKNGTTPVKGVDYFTPTEVQDITDNAANDAANRDKSASKITAGTFKGAVVASGQNETAYLLRNSKLSSAADAPTVNGQICWQYK